MVEADPVDYFQLIFVDTSRYQRTLPTSKAPTAHRGGSFILGGFTVLSVGRFSMLKTMRGLSATRLPGSGGRLPCCLALWNSWSWSTDLSGSQQSNLDNDWMLRLVRMGLDIRNFEMFDVRRCVLVFPSFPKFYLFDFFLFLHTKFFDS